MVALIPRLIPRIGPLGHVDIKASLAPVSVELPVLGHLPLCLLVEALLLDLLLQLLGLGNLALPHQLSNLRPEVQGIPFVEKLCELKSKFRFVELLVALRQGPGVGGHGLHMAEEGHADEECKRKKAEPGEKAASHHPGPKTKSHCAQVELQEKGVYEADHAHSAHVLQTPGLSLPL